MSDDAQEASVAVKSRLDVGDFFRFCDIVSEVLENLPAETLEQMRSGGEGGQSWRIGRDIIAQVMRAAPDKGQAFLAGLIDESPERFRGYPASAVLDVFEQFWHHPDATDFFSRAQSQFNRFTSEASTGAAGNPASAPSS